MAVKGHVHSCEKESKYTSQTGPTLNNLHNEVYRNEGIGSNRPMQEPKSYTGKELCQHTFYEVIRSEKFAQLCHLLLKSFPGIISERVLDVWTKIEQIGTDMVALAKSLSVISRVSFCEQAGSVSLCSTEVGKPDESDMNGKEDCIQFFDVYKACTCKNCGETADVRNCLVCDSCEEVYHIACIEPAIEEIPPGVILCQLHCQWRAVTMMIV
ncbi:hypothetical protein Leryth_026693 [Lithospermum erythrorhizon]|nr:hypothetical protein Leryth_026693 [Lithospermum erythrorhizon]